jgi:3-dehydroquinate dehydratase/shikimate dehydrogenase
MNNGKVCVPVCAENADEFVRGIREASDIADIIELRFDCLSRDDANTVLALLPRLEVKCPMIATFRPREQGGPREIGIDERKDFWENLPDIFWAGDLEEDALSFRTALNRRIVSFHDFGESSIDLAGIFERLAATDADMVKIASSVADVTDTIAFWNLLERESGRGKPLTPIAMGEAGKITRILGPAHGSALTYASLNSHTQMAPGQIPSADLIGVYRVRGLDRATDVYGVISGDTSYSISPFIQNAAFANAKLNSVFVPLQVKDVGSFFRRMVRPETREKDLNFRGFAVTMPHKESIMAHLDHIDETAEKIGAVNTVKLVDGKSYGANTDADGFIDPLIEYFGDLRGARVALAGAGGAARACLYALVRAGAEATVLSRDPGKARRLAEEFRSHSAGNLADGFAGFDIFVNATPLGTSGPLADKTVAESNGLKGAKMVYDLVYNPLETVLLREAANAGAETLSGIEMLISQGRRQFAIWTGLEAPVETMRAAAFEKLR